VCLLLESWDDKSLFQKWKFNFRIPSKDEYFHVNAKDVEMQNMNASGIVRANVGNKNRGKTFWFYFFLFYIQNIDVIFAKWSGLGPNNKNTLKISLNSCQNFGLLKIANQYFLLGSYETVLKSISRLLIS
jgi:hypothetical protein